MPQGMGATARVPRPLYNVALQGVPFVLRRIFREVYADWSRLNEANDRPLIVFSNHVSNFDAWFAMLLARRLGRRLWIPTTAEVLRRQPHLRLLGNYAVVRHDRELTAAQIQAVGRLATTERSGVWYFPEGGIVRAGLRVRPARGFLNLIEAVPSACIVPAAIHLEFFDRLRPYGWIRLGRAIATERCATVEMVRTELDRAEDALTNDLKTGSGRYQAVLRDGATAQLLRNVPCDYSRIARAIHSDIPTVKAILSGASQPADVDRFRDAIRIHCGRLYSDLMWPD